MKIREMAHHDVDKVLELGQAMHEESYFSFLTFNYCLLTFNFNT